MTLTNIEKAAKLMGYEYLGNIGGFFFKDAQGVAIEFNPYTNKADLVDAECALGIDVDWIDFNVAEGFVHANIFVGDEMLKHLELFADHPDKFTARANAVMAVVEQIYDAKFGKDGE